MRRLRRSTALVAADPTDAQSEIRISEIQRRQGHYDEALATLEKAKSQVQDSLELSYNEALIYDALGKYGQATDVLTGILDESTHADGKYSEQEKQNRAIFLGRLGIIDREENKTAEAVAAYKQIIDLGGEYAERGFDGEIDAYRDAHQWKEATEAAAEVAKALPKDHLAQLAYAVQLADTGQEAEGIALAKAQLTGGADDREVEERPGAGLHPAEAVQGGERAARQGRRAGHKAGREAGSALPARRVLRAAEDVRPGARLQFRKALAIDPHNPGVLNYLGYMLADQGQKLPEALKLIHEAVELEPQNGAYLDSLGWVYFKLGQYPEAEENLRKANERMNSDPTVHDHLGELYEKTGNLKMAVSQWERSMTEYAHSLAADADPEDVQKVQHKLESARVKLAKLGPASDKGAK